jgi:hypothetical protein
MSWFHPLELSGSEDGMDIDERARSKADRCIDGSAGRTTYTGLGGGNAGVGCERAQGFSRVRIGNAAPAVLRSSKG